MHRRFVLFVAVCGLVFISQSQALGVGVRHDFDAKTLASYVSLRFSSAVPPTVIKRVLATDGFSKRDLDLIAASPPSGKTSQHPAASAQTAVPGASFSQQISQDPLACPKSDPSCELDTQIEPDIAANPANPNNLVGVFQQGRYPDGASVDPGWASSFDGGKTWPYRGNASGLTVAVGGRFQRGSDPVVDFDTKHGTVLLTSLEASVVGCADFCDTAVGVNLSANAGRTFGAPVIAHEDANDPKANAFVFNDKEWVATDNNPQSPHYGRTYLAWDQIRCADPVCANFNQPVVVEYSDDGGRHWSPLIQATNEQPGSVHGEIGTQPVIEPNGDVVVAYADVAAGANTFAGSYKAVRSRDGGKTWSQPQLIDVATPAAEEPNALRAPNLPSATADPGGKIFVAFADQRFAVGRNDIVVKGSGDEGSTWTQAINATPGETGLDHFTPAIAFAGGRVDLTYRTHTPSSVNSDPAVHSVYRALTNGVTTAGPVELAAPSDASVAAFVTLEDQKLRFFGDYAGVAASPGGANAIWDHAQNFPAERSNPTNTHQRSFSALAR